MNKYIHNDLELNCVEVGHESQYIYLYKYIYICMYIVYIYIDT